MDWGGRERHGRSADGAQESGLVHVCSLARHQLPPQLGNNGLGIMDWGRMGTSKLSGQCARRVTSRYDLSCAILWKPG